MALFLRSNGLARLAPSVATASSSSAPSRVFSSSPASLGATPGKMVKKVKNVANKSKQGERGPKNRRRASYLKFDKDNIPHLVPEPIDETWTHVPVFSPENITADAIGQLQRFDFDILRSMLSWGYPTGIERASFPFSVIRQVTIDSTQLLDEVRTSPEPKETARQILNTGSGSGKSHLVMQSLAHAMQTGYITMYIPKAYRHINSLYGYKYDDKTGIFNQAALSMEILTKLVETESNIPLLSQIPLTQDYLWKPDIPYGAIAKKTPDVRFERLGRQGAERTLFDLAKFGAGEELASVQILEEVLRIIADQDKIPFFLGMDHAHAYFRKSEYRTPEGRQLESYHLSVPRLLLEYISGRKSFKRGVTLLAVCPLDTAYPITPSMIQGLGLSPNQFPHGRFGRYNRALFPTPPTDQLDVWHAENAGKLKLIEIGDGFTMREAVGLWEIKTARRRLHIVDSEDNFMSKYLESGGNPREFFRGINLAV